MNIKMKILILIGVIIVLLPGIIAPFFIENDKYNDNGADIISKKIRQRLENKKNNK